MAKKRKVKRKRGSYFSPLLSITLVLFLIGLFAILILYADQLKSYLKENVQVNVIFDDDSKEADIFHLQKMMEVEPSVIKTNYVDKEEAKKIMTEELGEDVDAVLGFNPFPSSLEIYFTADYANVDSIENFKKELDEFAFIKEISYQKVILENIDSNVRIIGMILLAFMSIFLLIAIILINNTIRLTLYSKRFLIKSMQLVGATQAFIRKPFIVRAVSFGLIGGVLANGLVVLLFYLSNSKIPYKIVSDTETNLLVALAIIIFGGLITGVSSYYSVRKYLRLKLDELY